VIREKTTATWTPTRPGKGLWQPRLDLGETFTFDKAVLNGQTIPVPRYSAILPTRDFNGDIEQACLTAGQSAGNIDEILPAARSSGA
jgi:hypothetical protein